MQSSESFVKSVVLKSVFLNDHPRWATVQRTFVGCGCAYTLYIGGPMPSPKTCVIGHKYENRKYKTNEL